MIQNGKGHTLITNDGHTILKDMAVMHPAAKMVWTCWRGSGLAGGHCADCYVGCLVGGSVSCTGCRGR